MTITDRKKVTFEEQVALNNANNCMKSYLGKKYQIPQWRTCEPPQVDRVETSVKLKLPKAEVPKKRGAYFK